MTLSLQTYAMPDLEDDRSMKIYEMSNHRDKEADTKFDNLSSDDDDSDMKIFEIR